MAPSHLATAWRSAVVPAHCLGRSNESLRSSDQVDRTTCSPHKSDRLSFLSLLHPPAFESYRSLRLQGPRASFSCNCALATFGFVPGEQTRFNFQILTRSVVFYSSRAQLFSPSYPFAPLLATGLALHFDIWPASGL